MEWTQSTVVHVELRGTFELLVRFPELAVTAVPTPSWKTLEVPQMHAFGVVVNNYNRQIS